VFVLIGTNGVEKVKWGLYPVQCQELDLPETELRQVQNASEVERIFRAQNGLFLNGGCHGEKQG
jgi:hypothetical protein